MEPEEIDDQQQNTQTDTGDTADTPDAGDETKTLADAMWGDKAGEDTETADDMDDDGNQIEPDDDGNKGGDGDEDTTGDEGKSEDDDRKPEDEDADVSDEDIVKGLSEKAQKRFRELVNTNKEMDRKLTGFTEIISDAQVTPQDMVDLLAYGKAIRTGNFDQARAIMAEQARQLELASGQPVEFGDALSDYPDLHQSVEAMELTREHALELARVRRSNEQQQRASQQQRQQEDQQSAQQEAIETGFNEVVSLAGEWKKTDLDWPVKEKLMVARAGLIQKNYHPSQWAAMTRLAYQEITETLRAARPATQRRDPQGLRPNAMGGGAKTPTNLHEAMWGTPEGQ